MKIALAGNPNSGKTTIFNAVTGKMEYVGNWPGVTVEKKVARLKGKYRRLFNNGAGEGDVLVVDLPGAYSISPFTGEEAITRDFVLDEKPDVIINIVDASNLERSLYFTTQLLELGIPMVVALNKADIIRRKGDVIDVEGLEGRLSCQVSLLSASRNEGLEDLIEKAAKASVSEEQVSKREVMEDSTRQEFTKKVVRDFMTKKTDAGEITFSDKLDRIVASPFLGLPIFALIMWGIYALSINGLGGFLSGYINDNLFGEIIPGAVNGFLSNLGVDSLLQSLIVDGAIGGVGAVMGFLPLIMLLFFFLALLEDSGYMARVAVIMDRYFKKIGLSGKSIIPMIVGTGCSIPGVMAARTIENKNERIATIMLTPFVPCGAKLPIIALMAAVFFPGSTWVFPGIYLLAAVVIVVSGLLIKKIFRLENESSFIMELPRYKMPSFRHAIRHMLKQARSFIVKASTIILVMNTLIWFMQTYGFNFKVAETQDGSILAALGGLIAPVLIPLGFIGWQMAAASLSGFIAKENVVATFAIILATSDQSLHSPGGPLSMIFNPVTALAFLAFNLFTPPCFAAIGAMNAEYQDKKWLGRAVLYQLATGYILAMGITQIGSLLVYGTPATGWLPAIFIAVIVAAILIYLIRRGRSVSNGDGLPEGES